MLGYSSRPHAWQVLAEVDFRFLLSPWPQKLILISHILPGLLASGIVNMDGVAGLSGWRWIFILEGITTVMLAILAGVVLPENLSSAKFLTDDEKEFACESCQLPSISLQANNNAASQCRNCILMGSNTPVARHRLPRLAKVGLKKTQKKRLIRTFRCLSILRKSSSSGEK